MSIVALIPARIRSRRVPKKNIMPLKGVPLIAYSISTALESGIFEDVVAVVDSQETADIATKYGASVFMEPEVSPSTSKDIRWVKMALSQLSESYDYFSILRPTSPFRTAATIHRAWNTWLRHSSADSLRAVEKCKEHPGKMWVVRNDRLLPLLPLTTDSHPWHSSPYGVLPEVFVQNSSLEIAKSEVMWQTGTIAGTNIIPFFTEGHEGIAIDHQYDWDLVESMVGSGAAVLPEIRMREKVAV